MGLPDFLCIGAQKAGTSWLFTKLQHHPDIWMPPIKELHYFDHLYVPENRRWTADHIRRSIKQSLKWNILNRNDVDLDFVAYMISLADAASMFTEDWYRRCFDRPAARGKTLGDITPEYSMISQEGIDYLHKLLGDIKIIYLIRHPVDRALSQLRMNAERRGLNSGSADWEALAREIDIKTRGAYATYIPRWMKVFPAGNFLFVPYREIGSDPQGVMRKIEAHLGVRSFNGYKRLEEKVFSSREADIPHSTVDYLREALADDTHFIESHFGHEFANAT